MVDSGFTSNRCLVLKGIYQIKKYIILNVKYNYLSVSPYNFLSKEGICLASQNQPSQNYCYTNH